MAYMGSTEDFLLFLSEQVSTEVAVGFDDDEGSRSQVGSDALMVRLHKNFEPVPALINQYLERTTRIIFDDCLA